MNIYPNQDSGVLTSTVWADGFVEVPEGTTIAKGDVVDYIFCQHDSVTLMKIVVQEADLIFEESKALCAGRTDIGAVASFVGLVRDLQEKLACSK